MCRAVTTYGLVAIIEHCQGTQPRRLHPSIAYQYEGQARGVPHGVEPQPRTADARCGLVTQHRLDPGHGGLGVGVDDVLSLGQFHQATHDEAGHSAPPAEVRIGEEAEQ